MTAFIWPVEVFTVDQVKVLAPRRAAPRHAVQQAWRERRTHRGARQLIVTAEVWLGSWDDHHAAADAPLSQPVMSGFESLQRGAVTPREGAVNLIAGS